MNRSTIFVLVDHLPVSSTTLDIMEDGPLNADWVHWRVCLGACRSVRVQHPALISLKPTCC